MVDPYKYKKDEVFIILTGNAFSHYLYLKRRALYVNRPIVGMKELYPVRRPGQKVSAGETFSIGWAYSVKFSPLPGGPNSLGVAIFKRTALGGGLKKPPLFLALALERIGFLDKIGPVEYMALVLAAQED